MSKPIERAQFLMMAAVFFISAQPYSLAPQLTRYIMVGCVASGIQQFIISFKKPVTP
jgi:hypothetical protein